MRVGGICISLCLSGLSREEGPGGRWLVLTEGESGPAMVGVEAVEEAGVPLLLFLVLGLLRAFGRMAESRGAGEKCVSVEGRLNELAMEEAVAQEGGKPASAILGVFRRQRCRN